LKSDYGPPKNLLGVGDRVDRRILVRMEVRREGEPDLGVAEQVADHPRVRVPLTSRLANE
jgi:hypothetical protein